MLTQVEQVSDASILSLEPGVLDANNVSRIKLDVQPFLKSQPRLILDMSAVTFIDSSGLGCLLSCLRQANSAGGDLRLCCLARPVRIVLEMVRMHKILEIYNTREEALRSFDTDPGTAGMQ